MAVWYEVERSRTGIENFMECNWCFHDFKIERAVYLPENRSAELFLKYDEPEGSVILRFLNVHAMRVVLDMEYGFPAEIGGSVLLLLDDGRFLWADNDFWGEKSKAHLEELKAESSWVQAERIVWAVTDSSGKPAEMPADKIDQVWTVWGKTERHHFELSPYQGSM